MFYRLVKTIDRILPIKSASAHCDIPCGIYDPTPAQIDALTVVRMMDLMAALDEGDEHGKLEYHNSMTRYIEVKEDHAEKTKHEIRVIYGDYIKDAHIEKHPELPKLFHKIMQLGSKARQSPARKDGLALVEAVNQFAEIFWATKDVKTKKAKAPYAPALEMVYPDL
jgi:nickel superoxide dismutase